MEDKYIVEPDLEELLRQLPQMEFTYPLPVKLLLGLLGPVLSVLPILSILSRNIREEPIGEIMAAAFVSCMGLLSIYATYRLLGKVILDNDRIVLSRFGWQKKVDFKHIKHIDNRKWRRAIILYSDSTDIRIEKQLTDYGLVHDIILHKTKHLTPGKTALSFPVILRGYKAHYWWMGGIFLIFVFLLWQSPPERVAVLFLLAGLGWLCMCLVVLIHLVAKVTLLPQTIQISNLFNTIEIPTLALIEAVAYKEYASERDPFYNLEITFDEWDIRELHKTWNFPAKYLWRNLSIIPQAKEYYVILLRGDSLNFDLRDICVFIRRNYLNEGK